MKCIYGILKDALPYLFGLVNNETQIVTIPYMNK